MVIPELDLARAPTTRSSRPWAVCPLAVQLIGQPHLRASMKLGVLAALEQRIGVRYAMTPMTPK